jgi:hypothetical protein
VIIIYSIIQMITFSPNDLTKVIQTEFPAEIKSLIDPEMMREFQEVATKANYAGTVIVILGGLLYCGGLALYYYTRRRHVEAFVRETPDWIRRQLLELDR